jgi:hypothetical protein
MAFESLPGAAGEQGDRREVLRDQYKPVRYTEYYQENKVFLTFSYRLVSWRPAKCW